MSTIYTHETATAWVCVDCHLAVAGYGPDETGHPMPEPFGTDPTVTDVTNGTNPNECQYLDDHREAVGAYVGSSTMDEWTAIYELHTECDHDSFSLAACEGCGSTLAGDRYAVTITISEPTTV